MDFANWCVNFGSLGLLLLYGMSNAAFAASTPVFFSVFKFEVLAKCLDIFADLVHSLLSGYILCSNLNVLVLFVDSKRKKKKART